MQEASRNTCSGFYKHKRGHGVGQLKHGLVLKSTEQFKSYPLCIDHGVTEGGRGAPSPASKREISVPQTFGLWHPPSSGPSPCLGLRGCRCQCPQMGPDQPCHLSGGDTCFRASSCHQQGSDAAMRAVCSGLVTLKCCLCIYIDIKRLLHLKGQQRGGPWKHAANTHTHTHTQCVQSKKKPAKLKVLVLSRGCLLAKEVVIKNAHSTPV